MSNKSTIRKRALQRIELENLRRFWMLSSKRDRTSIKTLAALQIFSSLLDLSILAFIMPLFSVLNSNKDESQIFAETWLRHIIGNGSAELLLMRFFSLMFLAYTVKSLIQLVIKVYSKRTRHRLSASVTDRVFSGYLQRPFSWHNLTKPPVLVRDVNESFLLIDQQITPLLTIVSEITLVIVTIMLLTLLQPLITITAALIVGCISFLAFKSVSRRVKKLGNDRLHHDTERSSIISQSFFGIREVKVLGLEKLLMKEVTKHTWSVTNAHNSLIMIGEITPIVLEFLVIGTICALVFLGLTLSVEVNYLLAILAFFSVSAIRIVPSAARISGGFQLLRYSSARITALLTEIETTEELHHDSIKTARKTLNQLARVKNSSILELSNVSFGYGSSGDLVLRNIFVNVEAGEFVGITGLSGSGKSTLMDVCMGLLNPITGEVSILGLMKDELSWESISYVSQQVFLFSGSVRYNIWPGDAGKDVTAEDEAQILDATGLKDFVDSLPLGIDTQIGDGGVKLSGGQRQRVGLARAIARKPKILALDEATSSLDNYSENQILSKLRSLGFTVLMVSHSTTSLMLCDRVLLLDNGTIAEDGDPLHVLETYQSFVKRSQTEP